MNMSSYSEFIKTVKANDEKFFFGESIKHLSNNYFVFNHVLDDDNIIINTNNVRIVKGSFVLIVDNDKAVYLKDWQVRKVHNYDLGVNTYCVKLNRKYFKPYTFRSCFEDFSFDQEDTFDSLNNVAASQNDLPLALGWMK